MAEEVLELSINETNKLREKLGLKPLRLEGDVAAPGGRPSSPGADNAETKEELELSVDASNELRAKLGLKPLKDAGSSTQKTNVVHKPAGNDRADKEAAARIERARLKRQVEDGIASTFGGSTLGSKDENASSWASQMRKSKKTAKASAKKAKKLETRRKEAENTYQDEDLTGIQVDHKMTELAEGSTTILTLKDESLLGGDDEDAAPTLENVNLKESKKQHDGLALKRQLELGMGRAGGYAGFDDDEFEELGGALGPSRNARGHRTDAALDEKAEKSEGFVIGKYKPDPSDANMTHYEAIQQGRAVSLVPQKSDVAAADYMTIEEEHAQKSTRKKKKDSTFKKDKKKKKHKKDKKKNRRRGDDDDDDDDDDSPTAIVRTGASKKPKSILDELEETAVEDKQEQWKRRRLEEGSTEAGSDGMMVSQGDVSEKEKANRFHQIMEKGNSRTKAAFEPSTSSSTRIDEDEEPDDSFLNAALAKARRMNQLRNLAQKKTSGAEAVAKAVQNSSIKENNEKTAETSKDGLTFAMDDTREFTRALQARSMQTKRTESRKAAPIQTSKAATPSTVKKEDTESNDMKVEDASDDDNDADMNIDELAKQVEDVTEDAEAVHGSGVGRGLASFVTMLKSTGELSQKRSTGEELRGRAKDQRNYDDYKPLELEKVVQIGPNATKKDHEFAKREIKLEYRDKHGRLLTSKEAYRELCYQFHGHGASKKNEEKRLKRIALEQAEARLASKSLSGARDGTAAGTLGALKATQKATGKAFLVHKT